MTALQAEEAEELGPGLLLALEAAEHAAGDGAGGGLLHAAHDHAQVARLHDDGDALRLEHRHDGVGDLPRQPLLHLQAAREHLGDARQLRDPDHVVVRDVPDMHLPQRIRNSIIYWAKLGSRENGGRGEGRGERGVEQWNSGTVEQTPTLPVKGTM